MQQVIAMKRSIHSCLKGHAHSLLKVLLNGLLILAEGGCGSGQAVVGVPDRLPVIQESEESASAVDPARSGQSRLFSELKIVHDMLGSPNPITRPSPARPQARGQDSPDSDQHKAVAMANFTQCITGSKPTTEYLLHHRSLDDLYLASGQIAQASGKFLESKSELKEFLKSGFGASGTVDFLVAQGGTSVDLSYANNYDETSHDIIYSYYIIATNPVVRMTNMKLTDAAVHFLNEKGLRAFYEKCGKELVVGFQTGGTARWLYHYRGFASAKARQVQLSIISTVKGIAQGIGMTGKMSAHLETRREQHDSKYSVETWSRFVGGEAVRLPNSPQEFEELLKQWPEMVRKSSRVTHIIYEPYKTVLAGQVAFDDAYNKEIEQNMAAMDKHLADIQFIHNKLMKFMTLGDSQSADRIAKLKELEELYEAVKQLQIDCGSAVKLTDCSLADMLTIKDRLNYKVKLPSGKDCGYHHKIIPVADCPAAQGRCARFAAAVIPAEPRASLQKFYVRTFDAIRMSRDRSGQNIVMSKRHQRMYERELKRLHEFERDQPQNYPTLCRDKQQERLPPQLSDYSYQAKVVSCENVYAARIAECLSGPGGLASGGPAFGVLGSTQPGLAAMPRWLAANFQLLGHNVLGTEQLSMDRCMFGVDSHDEEFWRCTVQVKAQAPFRCYGRYDGNPCERWQSPITPNCPPQQQLDPHRPKTCEVDMTAWLSERAG